MTTKIILIRHGQTPWSIKKRYYSFTDIDLDGEGIKQARKLYRRLRKEKIHKVYSSDSKRALDFAKIAFRGLPIKTTPALREMNFGIFEGLSYREIMEEYPEIYTRWLNNPYNTLIPEGENLNDFRERILKVFKKIISLSRNKTAAIVTHAGSIKIIIDDILKSKNIWEIKSDLASLNIIEFEKKKAKARIRLLNDISYLDG